jgi:hypothetical protein
MNKVSKEALRDRQGWPARQESLPVEWQCTQGIAAHVEQVVGSVARKPAALENSAPLTRIQREHRDPRLIEAFNPHREEHFSAAGKDLREEVGLRCLGLGQATGCAAAARGNREEPARKYRGVGVYTMVSSGPQLAPARTATLQRV